MPSKIKMIYIPLIVQGVLEVIIAVALFGVALMFSVGIALSELPEEIAATAIGASIFVAIGLVVAVLGVAHFVAAHGVKKKRSWSKVLAIVLGILMLGNFPVGTALGVLILVGAFSDDADGWFENGKAPETAQQS